MRCKVQRTSEATATQRSEVRRVWVGGPGKNSFNTAQPSKAAKSNEVPRAVRPTAPRNQSSKSETTSENFSARTIKPPPATLEGSSSVCN